MFNPKFLASRWDQNIELSSVLIRSTPAEIYGKTNKLNVPRPAKNFLTF
jgi:hypothetical protein